MAFSRRGRRSKIAPSAVKYVIHEVDTHDGFCSVIVETIESVDVAGEEEQVCLGVVTDRRVHDKTI